MHTLSILRTCEGCREADERQSTPWAGHRLEKLFFFFLMKKYFFLCCFPRNLCKPVFNHVKNTPASRHATPWYNMVSCVQFESSLAVITLELYFSDTFVPVVMV